ncbi:MAG: hypothetical protein IJS41_06600 [Clostridia bacterium]|nr:hypothetical protein [Clostridia bacterium]
MNAVRLDAERFSLRATDGLYVLSWLLCMTDGVLISYTTLNGADAARFVSLFLRVSALLVMLGKVIWDRKHRLAELLFTFAACSLLAVTLLRSGYNHLYYLLVACLGVWDVDVRKALWIDFAARFALTLLIVFGSLLGAIENYITYRMGSSDLRYSLGFNHPNTLASLIMSLVLEEAWLTRRRPSIPYTFAVIIAALPLYAVTLNRTAIGLMIAFPLLLPYAFRARPIGKAGRLFWEIFPLLVIGVSIAALFLHQRFLVFREFDLLMGNRFWNSLKVYREYGLSLLGQKVHLLSVRMAREQQASPILLDVAYLRTLIQAGPVVLLFHAALYVAAFRKACLNRDRYSILVYALFVLYGLFESGFNNVFMNFSLLLALRSWYGQTWLVRPDAAEGEGLSV